MCRFSSLSESSACFKFAIPNPSAAQVSKKLSILKRKFTIEQNRNPFFLNLPYSSCVAELKNKTEDA